MAVVWIPSLLRDLTEGRETIAVPGRTVGALIEELERAYPGIKARLCSGEALRSGIAVAVDTHLARHGLRQAVGDNSEVHFLPAVSGGCRGNYGLGSGGAACGGSPSARISWNWARL